MTNETITSDVPARLDRLPWSGWHWRIVTALGTSWLLDGLEVTLVGSLAGVLQSPAGLRLTDPQVAMAATIYLAGAVIGALFFGYLTDRLGRKRLFLVTLATYSLATLASAFTHSLFSFAVCRFFTGVGIGGEYAAINSAVDELIPAKVRGAVDLTVNGTFWVGGTVGAIAAWLLLSDRPFLGHTVPQDLGWRLAFGIGGCLGLGVLLLRLAVPESPRWLMLRGREKDATRVVDAIEQSVSNNNPAILPTINGDSLKITPRSHTPFKEIASNMLGENKQRSLLSLVLMVAQSFFFNAVFFTYGLVVKKFFHISDRNLPLQLLPFAVASFLGPLTLGRLFDKVGRKPMIVLTYAAAGAVLLGFAVPFGMGRLGLPGVAICLSIVFYIASSAASAAYLTVSEIFPIEIRAFAIAIFYSLGTLVGGVGAPLLFGFLIQTGSRPLVAAGYTLGALLMLTAAMFEAKFGIETAGKSLESISKPLQSR